MPMHRKYPTFYVLLREVGNSYKFELASSCTQGISHYLYRQDAKVIAFFPRPHFSLLRKHKKTLETLKFEEAIKMVLDMNPRIKYYTIGEVTYPEDEKGLLRIWWTDTKQRVSFFLRYPKYEGLNLETGKVIQANIFLIAKIDYTPKQLLELLEKAGVKLEGE